jgi:hypothetical protein
LHAAAGSIVAPQGAPVRPAETVARPPAPARPASPRRKVVYALIALLVVLGGVAWWWFHRPAPPYQVQDPGIYPFYDRVADQKPLKIGFIDADGKILVQPEWDGVAFGDIFGQTVAFNEGLCGVQKDGKWGYIDTGGHLVIPTQFDSANPFVEGLARVNLGSQVGFIDKKGQYAINPQFYEGGDFHDGLAAVRADGGWGFVNKAGTYVIKPHFQTADPNGFSDGLAGVCIPGKCGYINRSGVFAISPQFDSVSSFSEGLAPVRLAGKWGYVNTSGKIVVNPQFDQGYAFVEGRAVVLISGKIGTIDKNGKFILNPGQYGIFWHSDRLLAASNSNGIGFMTTDGRWLLQPFVGTHFLWGTVGKIIYIQLTGQNVTAPVSASGNVLAGWYKGASIQTLEQDINNETSAIQSMRALVAAEASYSGAYPAKGFTASIPALGPTQGTTPDDSHAGLVDATLATGTKDGYQFAVTIPAGTSIGGANLNYFLLAKPVAGHAGRTFCADSSGTVRYAAQGEECTINSPTL